MANCSPTTRMARDEALTASPTTTPVLRAFAALLGQIDRTLATERAVKALTATDPAYAATLREAELAVEAALTSARTLLDRPVTHAADRALRNMARLVRAALQAETEAGFDDLCTVLLRQPGAFAVEGTDALSFRTARYLARAGEQLAAIGTLDWWAAEADLSYDAERIPGSGIEPRL